VKADFLKTLTQTERKVWQAIPGGSLVDLRVDDSDGPQNEPAWGPERTVRAEALAAMVTSAAPVQAGGVAKLRLAGVRVLGRLDLAFAAVRVLLDFERCWFDGGFDICEATTGSIRFRGCFLEEFDASRAAVGGELALQGCRINHLGLYGTRVGDLEISGTTINAPGGVAVYGDLLVATAAVYCHDTVFHGQVRLPGARISGYLRLNGATMAESSGVALYAPGLRVETGLFAGRSVDGQDDVLTCDGEVDLSSARISGPLDLREARLGTLNLQGATIEGALHLDEGFTAEHVDLRRVRTPALFDGGAVQLASLRLEGLAYDELSPLPAAGFRLAWLARGPFHPQPYEQLAACYRSVGRDAEARRVLLARQRLRRRGANPASRLWGLLQDATTGYGYRPWLAGLWLVALLVAGSVYYTAHRPAPLAANGGPHFNSVAYTLDLLIPVVSLGQTSAWNPTGFGQVLSYALILCGWTLATSLLSGVTRVLARP
jgi:hypothetical protein